MDSLYGFRVIREGPGLLTVVDGNMGRQISAGETSPRYQSIIPQAARTVSRRRRLEQ